MKIFGLNPSQTFYMIKRAVQTDTKICHKREIVGHSSLSLSLSCVCIIIIAWAFVVPWLIDMYFFPYGVYSCGRLMGELTRQHLGNCPRVVRYVTHTHTQKKTNFLKVLVKKEEEEKREMKNTPNGLYTFFIEILSSSWGWVQPIPAY